MGAFLPSSRVMLSDGSFKRIDHLEVGESIQTYVESTETHDSDGRTHNNVGTYEASTIATITSSSVVNDYRIENGRKNYPVEGMFYLSFQNGSEFTESKFSIDTEFYTSDGFKKIEDSFSPAKHLILDSLNIPNSDNESYNLGSIEFYQVNDMEMPVSTSEDNSDDLIILSDTPLYTIGTANSNPYIVSNFIIKN